MPNTSLEAQLVELAREAGAEASATAAGTEFRRGSAVFASVSASVAEFRLDPEVAEAALDTPGTSPSGRGPDWVRLTVDDSRPHDSDRARAWFLSAWRNAG